MSAGGSSWFRLGRGKREEGTMEAATAKIEELTKANLELEQANHKLEECNKECQVLVKAMQGESDLMKDKLHREQEKGHHLEIDYQRVVKELRESNAEKEHWKETATRFQEDFSKSSEEKVQLKRSWTEAKGVFYVERVALQQQKDDAMKELEKQCRKTVALNKENEEFHARICSLPNGRFEVPPNPPNHFAGGFPIPTPDYERHGHWKQSAVDLLQGCDQQTSPSPMTVAQLRESVTHIKAIRAAKVLQIQARVGHKQQRKRTASDNSRDSSNCYPSHPQPVVSWVADTTNILANILRMKSFADVYLYQQEPTMKWMHSIVIPEINYCWKIVADYLDYSIPKKNEIKERNRDDPVNCCAELLEDWLSSNRGVQPKTWSTLVSVLGQIRNLQAGANRIEEQLMKKGLISRNQ